ncbi:hypothetical protein RN001_008312 [Aquatica leii]|uniref:Multidrug resistance-associated protein lethal(2)03659 n=1 Tax=Aquatica leii TaxID=1421715 RepID=A0AAN7PD57_9COLE|nr:hypothetical protein RN001_008312 [Aquatica leii]
MLWGCVLAFLECLVKPAQSLVLGWLITYYNHNYKEEAITKTQAYLYALGIILLTLLNVALLHPFMVNVMLTGLKMKIACCSLLYRKSLKLSNAAFETTSVGQMLNLLSNDVLAFHKCALMMHYVWVGPIQCIIVTYLMYREFELSSIFGIFLLLLFIPLYFYLGKMASKFRFKAALKTDNRVRFMNEIIMGIQVIKVYAWEKAIQKLVAFYRKNEMKYIRISSYVRAMYLTFDILIMQMLLYITVLAYVVFNDNIDAQKFFTLTIFYSSLRLTMATFFPQGLGLIAETRVSIQRMNKFLLYSEVETNTLLSMDRKNNKAIEFSNVSASWSTSSKDTLVNIDLSVTRGSLMAIVGSVGSGKSTLLNIILKELPLTKGKITIGGHISYASQDPWLFSSSIRQNILFGETLNLARYNDIIRICALEDDFKLLPYSDKTVIGRRGASLSGGQKARINLARAIYKKADIYLLDDPLSALDAHVGKQIFYECIKEFLKDKTVILVTHQLQYLKHVDRIVLLDNGTIKAEGDFDELQKHLEEFSKSFKEYVTENKTERGALKKAKKGMGEGNDEDQEIVKEQMTDGAVSKFVYKSYILAGANYTMVAFMVILFLTTQLLISGSAYFMTYWVNMKQYSNNSIPHFNNSEDGNSTNNDFTKEYYEDLDKSYIYIYSLIIIVLIIASLSRSFLFYKICMKASENLHNSMFDSIIHATMRFFNTNSPGRILNRFANDMGAVDTILPTVTIDTTQILLTASASLILICVINYWLLLPAIGVGIIFYFLKMYCLKTSRNIKRLEGVTRSPVFEHLSASLQGLNTIRAFEAQSILRKEFDVHQDLHSSSYHLFLTTSQAFGYILDCIGVVYIAIVTFSFLIIGNETYGGNVGLAITQCLGALMSLQWGIRQTAEMENNMTSVERILEYNSIEHEVQSKNKAPKNWPQFGEIIFANVYFKYYPKDPPVLKNINFTIRPLEKIGIVGRTGSGKSSILNALFLLSDVSGSIYIDNIDITKLNLQDLRSKISIIPQEPMIFSGSFRKNLDPFDEFGDEDLWRVLEEVELKDVVNELTGGLQSNISEGGSNLSVGQRQLICLARAILRNNKILVLDEATANVDPGTDELIQKTIRKKFDKCTVLTIAHRLHTVMDSDKIMVVNDGKVVEFDRPNVLLQNRNGYFYEMVQESGKTKHGAGN